jgi:hypothetical protein
MTRLFIDGEFTLVLLDIIVVGVKIIISLLL